MSDKEIVRPLRKLPILRRGIDINIARGFGSGFMDNLGKIKDAMNHLEINSKGIFVPKDILDDINKSVDDLINKKKKEVNNG